MLSFVSAHSMAQVVDAEAKRQAKYDAQQELAGNSDAAAYRLKHFLRQVEHETEHRNEDKVIEESKPTIVVLWAQRAPSQDAGKNGQAVDSDCVCSEPAHGDGIIEAMMPMGWSEFDGIY
jgi:formate-dependent nitrite reductase cytochrome c552 subunit